MNPLGINYFSRFSLEYDPFVKNSKDVFIENTESREVIARLEYLKQVRGFGLLTGESGLGKTTCLRTWVNRLNKSLFKVVYTCMATLTVSDFYRNLSAAFGVEPSFRKAENFRKIQNEITRCSVEKKVTPVVILDEATHISTGILNDLKSIFNFEMDSRDRAIVIISGESQINNVLNLNSLEAVRQRITMNYNMEGLNKADGRDYISNKLQSAGSTGVVFNEPAIEGILNYAEGKPRVINRVCTTSMMIADRSCINQVTADEVMKAFNEIQLG